VFISPDDHRPKVLMLMTFRIHFRQNNFDLIIEWQEPVRVEIEFVIFPH